MRWLIAVMLVACSGGPSDAPWTEAQKRALVDEACPIVKHAFLYKVEKDGMTSYVLGTRHIGIGLEKFSPSLVKLLDQQRLMVFETPMDAPSMPLPDQPRARDALGPDAWKRYRELAGRRVADAVADKPLVVAALMVEAQFEDLHHSLEKELWNAAKQAKLTQRGVETDAFQTNLLVKVTEPRLVRAQLANTTSRDAIRADLVKEISSYCAGEDKPVFDPSTERDLETAGYSPAEIATYEDDVVYGRNRAWIPKLEELFADGKVFVAVGAAHLRGDRGVPALLRADGYTVTRIDP